MRDGADPRHGSAPGRRCSFIAHEFQVIDAKEDLQAPRKLSSALSTFGGDNQGGISGDWAFLEQRLQRFDYKGDFAYALMLSSCFSTEGGDNCAVWG